MPRMRVFAAALALLLVPPAAAHSGSLTIDSASYAGGASQEGGLAALYILHNQEAAFRPDLRLDLQAGAVQAYEIERSAIVPLPGAEFQIPVNDPDPAAAKTRRLSLSDAVATLDGFQDGFQIHLVPAGPVKFSATSDAGALLRYDSLFMAPGRFAPAAAADTPDQEPESPQFWHVRIDEPLLVHDDQATRFAIEASGDFTLELRSVSLQAQDASGTHRLQSGTWQQPLAPGPAAAAATRQTDVLLRLAIEGGVLRLVLGGASAEILWAAYSAASVHDGEVLLRGATGTLEQDGARVELAGTPFALPAGSVLTLAPGAQRLGVDVAADDAARLTASSPFLAAGPSIAVGLAAVASLAIAVLLGLLARRNGSTLAHVEAAIEAQRYAHAARVARRILRRSPGQEDAMLARAIALSRGGDLRQAVDELEGHIAVRGASDGSLHYVLGVALLDLGKQEPARAALAEAVRRTPALAADVAGRLGSTAASPMPTMSPLPEGDAYA